VRSDLEAYPRASLTSLADGSAEFVGPSKEFERVYDLQHPLRAPCITSRRWKKCASSKARREDHQDRDQAFPCFPGPAVYPFDLPGGKNLLLFGENGIGKSSLYHALNELFNIDLRAPSFGDLANLFGKGENDQDVTDGHVTVYLDGSPPVSLTWSQGGVRANRPYSD
jgi:hypothetical protein